MKAAITTLVFLCLTLTSCTQCGEDKKVSTDTKESPSSLPASEVEITDIVVGDGPEAVDGKKVTVHYVGTLTDGKKFDSSVDRGAPFSFALGAGNVIAGWDQGVKGMKVGGKRKLVIPHTLAYGENGVKGVIPPKASLVFEIELLKVQ